MSDKPVSQPPAHDARRTFLKRMVAAGFTAPLITALGPAASAAAQPRKDEHDGGHPQHREHCHTSTTAPPTTTSTTTTSTTTTTAALTTTAAPATTTTAGPG